MTVMRGTGNELGRLYAAFFAWLDSQPPEIRDEINKAWKDGENKEQARLDWIHGCTKNFGFVPPKEVDVEPARPKAEPTFAGDLRDVNPKFIKWFSAQSDEIKSHIEWAWGRTLQDENINHNHRHGSHARLTSLLKWCAEHYGYDFT